MTRTSGQRPGAMVNGYVPGNEADIGAREARMIERRARLLGPGYRLFYAKPIHVVRGSGVWLYGENGEAFLDLYNNVASVGHCHPHVVEAIHRQSQVLNTHTRYLHESVLDCAERLLNTMPGELGHVMFTCTGSEANDLALRIAQDFTGANGVIVTNNAYHGVTHAVSQFSPSLGSYVKPGPHVRLVPTPLPAGAGVDVGAVFADGVRAAIADLQATGIGVAAFYCDTIFSSDGVFVDPAGFLRKAVEAVHAAGGVFIADEVQPGFARTGESMWGFQRHGVVPDIATMGKPMGNGHPVAGLAVRPALVERFGKNARYFNTFGGNPVSCAAALAVMDVIEQEGLLAHARDVGGYLRLGLNELATRHEALGGVRGIGLFVGVDIIRDGVPDEARAAAIVARLRQERILISATGPDGNVLKIRPPLVIRRSEIELFLSVLDRILVDQ